mmetsp:Transcript_31866/g.85192  ORF Transcript_31866/g.85192 Transcript_31866/m.85192 type:complete len:85 (-) Transcript_31866:2251-2505(-)
MCVERLVSWSSRREHAVEPACTPTGRTLALVVAVVDLVESEPVFHGSFGARVCSRELGHPFARQSCVRQLAEEQDSAHLQRDGF